jgi:hydrogenase maturation protein HypF
VKAVKLHISGTVQGVGFRPFVYRLARKHNLCGWVHNASDGVHLHVQGEEAKLAGFVRALSEQAPPAAIITNISKTDVQPQQYSDFLISESGVANSKSTHISPDIATCSNCLQELDDSNNRRYHYPFINCTNCGPRFTIIKGLPYDRGQTSMSDFPMCESCSAEYHNPDDRRFHAQPDACFSCEPVLSFKRKDYPLMVGHTAATSDAIIEQVVELLLAGGIVAIKGIGGYHLACDAGNQNAVLKLRPRTLRPHRPFACMVANLEMAQALCHVSPQEAALLTGSVRPIVLLMRKLDLQPVNCCLQTPGKPASDVLTQAIAPAVANPLPELGLMLPATPLHHLLLNAIGKPLVMTSANLSEEPIIAQNSQAHQALQAIADAWLDNNRPIISRYDDSVVRVVNGNLQMVRRARGYAPAPIALSASTEDKDIPADLNREFNQTTILACGPEQKSTFCFLRDGEAIVSQHLGDLDNLNSFNNYQDTIQLYQELFALQPHILACDMHPNYRASQMARELARQLPTVRQGQWQKPGMENPALFEVQHHHAHIAAVLAENALPSDTTVIGIALDGTGYGLDANIWGGEILIACQLEFSRFGHLQYFPLPGGSSAIKHPLRVAYALLKQYNLDTHPAANVLLQKISAQKPVLDKLLASGLNTPQTSSAGRFFDAISALSNLCENPSYQGQPAIHLEAALWQHLRENSPAPNSNKVAGKAQDGSEYPDPNLLNSLPNNPKYHFLVENNVLCPASLLATILDDLAAGACVGHIALGFHLAWLEALTSICQTARQATGIDTVALSGGVFMNRFLITLLPQRLQDAGFKVLLHKQLPANDGCIAYGQAAIAQARMQHLYKSCTIKAT